MKILAIFFKIIAVITGLLMFLVSLFFYSNPQQVLNTPLGAYLTVAKIRMMCSVYMAYALLFLIPNAVLLRVRVASLSYMIITFLVALYLSFQLLTASWGHLKGYYLLYIFCLLSAGLSHLCMYVHVGKSDE